MTYVALLRGINVGGKRIIKMADLRAMVEKAGGSDVQTFIQSGNVVFRAKKPIAKLGAAISKAAGFDVITIVLTADEYRAVVSKNPYEDIEYVHVFFGDAKPPALDKLVRDEGEHCTAIGNHVYGYFPNGVGNSKLAGALGKALPAATARNWRTTLSIAALLDSPA